MHVIPVLDVRDNLVVRAIRGRRRDYAPLKSRITEAIDPPGVLESLLSWHPFDTIYIADLSAIEQHGNSNRIILDLAERFSEVCFWLDGGFRKPVDLEPFAHRLGIRPVLGSETQTSPAGYRALYQFAGSCGDPVLSLDYAQGRPLGPPALFEDTAYWPHTIIVMNLDHVGANRGPDWALLKAVQIRALDRDIVAAGGVRNTGDLEKLSSIGIDNTLIASAIHDGQLTAADLDAVP